jgi:hypothetical protein
VNQFGLHKYIFIPAAKLLGLFQIALEKCGNSSSLPAAVLRNSGVKYSELQEQIVQGLQQ